MTEIEVTDPTHPLFGRRFLLRSIGTLERGASHVFVAYRDFMTLRIPRAATTLTPPRSGVAPKLTLDAVLDLVTLAEQCEALCPLHRPTSGSNCHPSSDSPSTATSTLSSTR